jgi:hypothetical protein
MVGSNGPRSAAPPPRATPAEPFRENLELPE